MGESRRYIILTAIIAIAGILPASCSSNSNEKTYKYLGDHKVSTVKNVNVTLEIPDQFFYDLVECIVLTPDGKIFEIQPESNITIENVVLFTKTCGIKFIDMPTSFQGNWTLRTTWKYLGPSLDHYQMSFIVTVEEYIEAVPHNLIATYSGEDIYIEPEYPIEVKSCYVGPPKDSTPWFKIHDGCKFIININESSNGVWTLGGIGEYSILANVTINVKDFPVIHESDRIINLIHNMPGLLVMGPEDAVYCKAVDPRHNEYVFNGQCVVDIGRVIDSYAGIWNVFVGFENATRLIEYKYNVTVTDRIDSLHTDYIMESSELTSNELRLKCSLLDRIKTCRMTRSDGTTFIMNPNIGNGKYSFYGKGTHRNVNGHTISECGIKIEKPSPEDLLRWQCSMLRDDGVEVRSYVHPKSSENETELEEENNNKPRQSEIMTHVGNTLEMKCDNYRRIDYCWFQAPNNTVYSVYPGFNNSEYEYMGQGLDVGECGIRIHNAKAEHRGYWRCNMGVEDGRDTQHQIKVTIFDSLAVGTFNAYFMSSNVTVGCKTYDNSSVEYCRFIRPDGKGINPSKVSEHYYGSGTNVDDGVCSLTVVNPTALDLGVWDCVVKPHGRPEHMTKFTMYSGWVYIPKSNFTIVIVVIFYITLSMALLYLCLVVCTRTNIGKRCASRIRTLRTSIRNSIRKDRDMTNC